MYSSVLQNEERERCLYVEVDAEIVKGMKTDSFVELELGCELGLGLESESESEFDSVMK